MITNNKIQSIKDLTLRLETLRHQNKKIVHCHGVFDLLHIGHIRYFEQACLLGDILVVTLTPDCFVDKGPHRPAFNQDYRAETIASLSCVDYVAINEWPTAEETLQCLRPDYYVKGSEFKNTSDDMTGKIGLEEKIVKQIRAQLAFTEDVVFSSTNLINRHLSNFSDEMQQYLSIFRERYQIDDILQIIEDMSSLKVLVVGDTILDEYQYCEAIGKSSKDPVLAMKYQSHDLFAGGVLAVANHVANFAGQVHLATFIGERNSYEDFIRSKLHPNIKPYLGVQVGAPTLIKRRFIDSYTFNKLFEVYIMDDQGPDTDQDAKMCQWLMEEIPKYDLVIASDFGHGAVTPNMIDVLTQHSGYLAVNTQANAGNRGFHTITHYPHADFACIAEHEIRLEKRSLEGRLRPMMDSIGKQLGTRAFVVTRGRRGCYVMGTQNSFVAVPAFAKKIVDRVGAGDAFFAITSMAAVQDVDIELIGFIGNVVGTLAVEVIGNQKFIDKMAVKKYIVSLLK